MICPFCNAEIPDDSRVCEECHRRLPKVKPDNAGEAPPNANANAVLPNANAGGIPPNANAGGTPPNAKENGAPPNTNEGGTPPNASAGGKPEPEGGNSFSGFGSNSFFSDDVEEAARQRFKEIKRGMEDSSETLGENDDGCQALTTIEDGVGSREIEVQYAVNRVFLPGGQVDLHLRLRGLSIQVEDAHFWLSTVLAGNERRQEGGFHRDGEYLDATVPYYIEKDSLCGNVTVNYYICCYSRDAIRFYKFEARHEILARAARTNIVHTSVQLGEGSILKDSQFDGFGNVAFKDNEELARKMNLQEPSYRVVRERGTAWRPEDYLWSGDYLKPEQMEKFTLLIGGFAVYVTAKSDNIKFGRHPERNDFAVLDWKNNKDTDEFPTCRISREQLWIENCGDSVILFTDKASTLLNGVSPQIGGNAGIPIESDCDLAMGPIHFGMRIQYCYMRRTSPMCVNCMARKVQSVTFSRKDGLPEGFALVWQCCELTQLDSSLAGFRLYRRNGGFMLATPSGKLLNLVRGMNWMEGNLNISVRPFEQRLIGQVTF